VAGERENSGIFYGWIIVVACFLVTMTLGETFWSFGVFFKSLEEDFPSWSRGVISSGYTSFLIAMAISLVASGRLADRYSPRPIIAVSAVIAGTGIALCSQVDTINQFRGFLFIAGLGAGATWSVPNSTVVRWFFGRQKAWLALSIVVSGTGIGALIFAPLINYFIDISGWRDAFLYVGIIMFVILASAAFLIRPSPPIGVRGLQIVEARGESPGPRRESSLWGVLTTPRFLGLTFIVTVVVSVFHVLSVHLVAYAVDIGITRTTAAAAIGILGGVSVPGRFVSGMISQSVGWRKTLALALFGMGVFTAWLLALDATWMLYCFVISYGLCHGMRITAQLGILSSLFGLGSLGQIIGISTAVAQAVGAFAPWVAGLIFDATDSYEAVFAALMAALAAAGFVAIIMKE